MNASFIKEIKDYLESIRSIISPVKIINQNIPHIIDTQRGKVNVLVKYVECHMIKYLSIPLINIRKRLV